MTDRIANPWGERTPFGQGHEWLLEWYGPKGEHVHYHQAVLLLDEPCP